jgi:hypothetical protein
MARDEFWDFARAFFGMARRDGAADADPSAGPAAPPSPPAKRVVILLNGGAERRLVINGGDTEGVVKAISEAMASGAPSVTVAGTTTLRVAAIDAVYVTTA